MTARRRAVVAVHRWLSLAVALLWLLQAASGVAIMFHWEIDDATLASRTVPTDLVAIGHRIDMIARHGGRVTQMWTTGSDAGRYDLTVITPPGDAETTVRIIGDGTPLRTVRDGERNAINTLVVLHQNLLAGDIGGWIIGLSGVLLITNLVAGLIAAWPRRGTWRRALTPSTSGPAAARHYGWHRALGLVGVIPALLLVLAGVLLAFEDGVGTMIGAREVTMVAQPGRATIGFADAVGTALRAMPGATLTAVNLPDEADATYRVHLLAPGERTRPYGASLVFVDGITGRIRGTFPVEQAEPARALLAFLFPVHTGQVAGLWSRVAVFCLGLWLASMVLIGLRLWWLRRAARRRGTRAAVR